MEVQPGQRMLMNQHPVLAEGEVWRVTLTQQRLGQDVGYSHDRETVYQAKVPREKMTCALTAVLWYRVVLQKHKQQNAILPNSYKQRIRQAQFQVRRRLEQDDGKYCVFTLTLPKLQRSKLTLKVET